MIKVNGCACGVVECTRCRWKKMIVVGWENDNIACPATTRVTSLRSSLLTFLLRHFTVAEGVTNVRIQGLILVNGLANDGNNVADASGGCLLMQQDAGLHILNVEFRNCSATGIFVRSVGVCAPRLLVWGVTHTQWVQLHRCRCTSVCMLHACMHACMHAYIHTYMHALAQMCQSVAPIGIHHFCSCGHR